MADLRVGTGFDAHALEPGMPLVLGGVSFRGTRGLAGHSDGDVIAHALIDALLGAAGLGDIGALFPSDDPELKGVSSVELLREAYAQVRRLARARERGRVLIGQEPRIAPCASRCARSSRRARRRPSARPCARRRRRARLHRDGEKGWRPRRTPAATGDLPHPHARGARPARHDARALGPRSWRTTRSSRRSGRGSTTSSGFPALGGRRQKTVAYACTLPVQWTACPSSAASSLGDVERGRRRADDALRRRRRDRAG